MLLLGQIETETAKQAASAFATNFTTLDWVIVAVYLSASLLVGVFANKFIHTVKAYVVAGGGAGTALNVASQLGTGLGLVTLMYASIDAFTRGFSYTILPLIAVIVGAITGATGIVIYRLREMNLLTIPEFFGRRYGRRVRILSGSLCAVAGIVNMGLFPKMGAVFITYVTGFGADVEDTTVIVNVITSVLIVLVLVYTVLGGMVSVIITDYVQFLVLGIGMAIGIYFCLTSPELGWDRMVDTIAEERGATMFNPIAETVSVPPANVDANTLSQIPEEFLKPVLDASGSPEAQSLSAYGWLWICYMFLVMFFAGLCWAPEASRALTAKDPTVSKRTVLWSVPGLFARLAIPTLWGIAAFTLIASNDELRNFFFPTNALYGMQGPVNEPAAAMPLVLGKVIPAGLLGILVAGLMAAFMSTHDSYFLCWASVISRDVISPMRGDRLNDREEIFIMRVSVVLIGLFLLVWGVWYELPDSVWSYMAVSGTIYLSGAGVTILGGCYWKHSSTAGAYAGLLTGTLAIAGLFLNHINPQLKSLGIDHEIKIEEVGLFTFAACAIMFVVFSLLIPDRNTGEARDS